MKKNFFFEKKIYVIKNTFPNSQFGEILATQGGPLRIQRPKLKNTNLLIKILPGFFSIFEKFYFLGLFLTKFWTIWVGGGAQNPVGIFWELGTVKSTYFSLFWTYFDLNTRGDPCLIFGVKNRTPSNSILLIFRQK